MSSGVYREVVANEKLVFTWAWESRAGTRIAGDGAAQAGRRRHATDADARAVVDEATRDGHQQGWNGALDKLEKLVAMSDTRMQ